MKARNLIIAMVLVVAAGAIGWYAWQKTKKKESTGERRIAYYQSSMHPWIKSDKPGTCTICGMRLTPIYEGEKGFDVDSDMVTLDPSSIQVVNVQSEAPEVREIHRTLRVAGRIELDETRIRVLSAYVDGRVEKLFANYVGAQVKEGEPLAVLYSPSLLSAEREYLNVLGQTNLASTPRLAEEHARVVEAARQRLRLLGLTAADIERLGSQGATNYTTTMAAPMSGTVLARSVLEGQYVKEGDRMFELADLSRLWFKFDVYEKDLPLIKTGLTVRVSTPALTGTTLQGVITFIEPTINETTRSARVRVELDNRGGLLYNGLYAEGLLQLALGEGLTVPRSAVLDPGDFTRVFIDEGGGAYELRRVQVGRRGDRYWEIVEGVFDDELVVTSGNLLLDSQAQINRSGSAAAHDHQHEMEDGEDGEEDQDEEEEKEAP